MTSIFQCRIVCTALAKCPRYNIEKKANVCLVSTSSRTVPATCVLYVRAEGFEHPRPPPHDPPPPTFPRACNEREILCSGHNHDIDFGEQQVSKFIELNKHGRHYIHTYTVGGSN